MPGATGGQGERKLETASAAQLRSAGLVGVPCSNYGTGTYFPFFQVQRLAFDVIWTS